MGSATHTSYLINDRSYVSIVKKEIHRLALEANFRKHKIDELDIIVAEITSNLVKHAGGGEILAGVIHDAGETGIELIAIDKGPGIKDVKRMQVDGVSTTKTLGGGLGGIQRLSDSFHLYSQLDWGTVLISRKYKNEKPQPVQTKIDVRALIVCKDGETACGDGWYQKVTKEYIKIFVGDGLGHGPHANLAVSEAINAFKLSPDNSPAETFRFIHQSIKKTRGAVAMIMMYHIKTKEWKICGIGNIALKLSGYLTSKSHISYNGIVGHNIPNTMNDQLIPGEQVRHFALCSDGIISRWDLAKYPMISREDLSIQAAAIYKDFGRRTDDMSVIIGKMN